MQFLLGIDLGTTGLKAVVFDLQGRPRGKGFATNPYLARPQGWAEQDPETYWEHLCTACRQLWQETVVPREAIAGVTLTTMRSTLINVDRAGNALRPAIVWLDQRRTEGLKPISGLWGAGFRLSNMADTVAYFQAEAECNWLQRYQPRVWDSTFKYLFLSGYLTHRLTGRFVDSVACQVGYIPFDYKALNWSKPWDWKWRAVPMEPRVLPDLIPPTGQLGEVTPVRRWLVGILLHKLRLYEQHNLFGRLIGAQPAGKRGTKTIQ